MSKDPAFPRRIFLAGLGATCALGGVFVWERKTRPRVHFWPEPSVVVHGLRADYPSNFGKKRVYLDAGHGAPNNPGNSSCICQDEQDFTLDVAENVASWLRKTGHFEVKLSREGSERVTYATRVETAERWNADVFVSIHSDIRGQTGETQKLGRDKVCRVNLGTPGFSVLLSEDGEEKLVSARKKLARSTARRMREAGFGGYGGGEYGTLYAKDPEENGVFFDRHAFEQRIFVLWKPTMPSMIVETHHALDPREVQLWGRAATHDVFASVIAASLVDALANEGAGP